MLPSSGSVAVPWKTMLAPAEKLEPVEGLTIVTDGGTSCGGGSSSPTAAGAPETPSPSPPPSVPFRGGVPRAPPHPLPLAPDTPAGGVGGDGASQTVFFFS